MAGAAGAAQRLMASLTSCSLSSSAWISSSVDFQEERSAVGEAAEAEAAPGEPGEGDGSVVNGEGSGGGRARAQAQPWLA